MEIFSRIIIIIPFLTGLMLVASATAGSGWGDASSVPARGTHAYFSALRKDYKFRLINLGDPAAALAGLDVYWQAYYQIDIRIEPCKDASLTGGLKDQCCVGTGVVNCQDSSDPIIAGDDLHIAYQQNAHISNCLGTEFEDDPNCGTYIEIHRSVDAVNPTSITAEQAEVLAEVQLTDNNGAYMTAYIGTGRLCAGSYELWWVVRTRSGPYVQFRKKFVVAYPNCA
jgi:hypothetical protein